MTPYAQAAYDYLRAGWSPIPLPFKKKDPPPDNPRLTGAAGRYVTEADVRAWTKSPKPVRVSAGNLSYVASNIALRLPRYVIGIDVDRYDGKTGAKTFADAEKKWGALPDTWVSTSREDGSGIMLYRVPEGLAWPGQVGPGVETIRWDHRYAVVAPSIHDKTGLTYHWIKPGGVRVDDEIPSVDELAELPQAWVDGLTSGKQWQERAADEMTQDDVRRWLNGRKAATCTVMAATTARGQKLLRAAGDDGGAHEVARDAAWGVIGDAASGHGGVVDALAALRKTFLTNVKGRRASGAGEAEWARIVIHGVEKVCAEGAPAKEDMCEAYDGSGSSEPNTSSADRPDASERTSGSTAFDYARDDIGNAQRLRAALGTDARYVTAYKAWALYDASSGLWSIDESDGPIRREAVKVVRKMEEEAAFIEEADAAKAFRAFVRASGNLRKIKDMIEMCRALKGMSIKAGEFDATPSVLVCSNGVVELAADGARFRGTRHSDYATLCTGTPYVEGALHEEWNEFIARVLPDKEDRRWVQTLAGYTLLGLNPERALIIAKGPTTCGKTTFAEAVQAALGEYADPFNLSLLRVKQDESARADIIAALPRRMIVAAEASAEWFLHADVIKLFTGGERIKARPLNSNVYVTRRPAFTPWLVTNSYPQIPGADKALWRRLKTAPFLVSLAESEVDTGLADRLRSPEARAAILAWCVRGWDLYTRDGLREMPPAAALAALEAREEMSDLDAFLASTCDFAAEYEEVAMDLYEAYKSWTTSNADEKHMLSLTAWGRAMSAKGYDKFRGRSGSYKEGDNKAVFRRGLRLNSAWSRLR